MGGKFINMGTFIVGEEGTDILVKLFANVDDECIDLTKEAKQLNHKIRNWRGNNNG